MTSSVLFEKKDRIAIISLNLPDKLNPLTPDLRKELKKALQTFDKDSECRVAIFRGIGRAFCAGGDLEELKDGMTAVHGVDHMKGCNEITMMIASIAKPIIASVNGVAAGAGFSMAMACDIVIASEKSSFMQAFGKVALVPDMGSLYYLPRVVGMHRAKELIWTARRISAEEAKEMGIVNTLVAPEKLEEATLAFAEQLANGPAFAQSLGKTLLARSLESSLEDMMAFEGLAQALCMQSHDHKEGVSAFYEKREAKFKGK